MAGFLGLGAFLAGAASGVSSFRERTDSPFPNALAELARIMKDGAEFRIGTDHPIYREWTMLQMAERSDFEWLAEGPQDWLTRPDDWPETRYEVKALEGRATYFRFRRIPRAEVQASQ